MGVIVVTGASRGLGAGLVEAFEAAGHQVHGCSRSTGVDVSDSDAVEAFANGIGAPVDVWVNNAGLLGPIAPLRDIDPTEAAEVLAVNVLGVVHGTRWFVRHRRSLGGGGVLFNLSSGAATEAPHSWSIYGASKSAVENITHVVQLEEAEIGLRAYAVAPGLVDTSMQAQLRETDFPARDRFLDAKRREAFNSPGWVACHLLDVAFGDARPPVSWRVPDEPR